MPSLSIARDFLKDYASLEKTVQKSVDKALANFQEHTHAGLHLEKLSGARDPRIRTIRITDFWRGIVLAPIHGDVYQLLTVLPHDKANKYATSKLFSVNHAYGVFEVRDQSALDHVEPVLRTQASEAEERLFGRVKDSELIHLGIDSTVLPLVRLMVSEAHLAPLATWLPEVQFEALQGLAMGYSADEVWDLLCDRLFDEQPDTDIDPTDLAAAAARTPDRFTLVTGPDELAAMLANPFALWRTFLHQRQESIAYRPQYTGPALVTGGAGTGKTVAALHRTAFLARRLPPGETTDILLTTFTGNLATALQDHLKLLVPDDWISNRVQVSTVNSVAYQIVQQTEGVQPEIIGRHANTRLWHAASKHIDGVLSAKFLESEWEQVVVAQDLLDRDAYLTCERKGRGKKLSAPREIVWSGITHALDQLRANGQRTHLQIVADAARILADQDRTLFRHVLVDEGQDLHPAHWRLLRRIVGSQPDDLFIVSDPNQRIYDNRVSLNSLDIKVRGRSKRLTVGYRTTQEILNWSLRVLDGIEATGLDDEPDTLEGYHSQLHGRRPIVHAFTDRRAELEGLVQQVREWLAAGIEAHAIGVAARTVSTVKEVREALDQAGITGNGKHKADVVRVETMHGMKGLEFRCAAVVGVDRDAVPLPAAVTPANDDATTHAQDTLRERCLLFVASTRARDALYVSHVGQPSDFLTSTSSS